MMHVAFVREGEGPYPAWSGYVVCHDDEPGRHEVIPCTGKCTKTRCPTCSEKLDFRP